MSDDAGFLKPDLAAMIIKRWKECDELLYEERRNYWLNFAFFHGHQWLWWDSHRKVVNSLPTIQGDNERVRIVINKMKPRWEGLMGRMLGRNLSFESKATAADDASAQGAQLAEWIVEALRDDQDWESIRAENLFNTLAGGTSAIAIEWEEHADRIWLNAQDQNLSGDGDVSLVPLSITEFSIEGGSRRAKNARWWISAISSPPEQVKDKYDLKWLPISDASAAFSPLQRRIMSERGVGTNISLATVYTMYERPTRQNPDGRHAAVCNGKVLFNRKWPFAFDKLNLQIFRAADIPSRWTGDTFVNDARKVQTLYNMVRSAIAEHIKLAGNARLLVPKGALDDDSELTDEAGEIVSYDHEAGAPSYMLPAQLGRIVQMEPAALEAELDDIMHTHATSRGQAPGDRNSGLALSILAEKDDTPLGIMCRDQSNGWGQIAGMVLDELAQRVQEKRKATVKIGGSVPLEMEWNGAMLKGQTRVYVPLEATMPQSRNAQQAQLTNLAQAFPQLGSAMTPAQILKMIEIPGQKSLEQILDSDVDCAQNENWRMSVGEVCFPMKWHDHPKHIAELNAFRNTREFEKSDDSIKQLFQAHADAHQKLVEEELMGQAQMNAAHPGSAALPQAHEPIGSAVPPPLAEQQAQQQIPGAP